MKGLEVYKLQFITLDYSLLNYGKII